MSEWISEWIIVKDRLPEPNKVVLVWAPKSQDWRLDYWTDSKSGSEIFQGKDVFISTWSHWMPLPSPPK